MKNEPTSAMIAGIMSGVAAACACLTIVLALQNRSLQNQLSDSRRLWSEALSSTADLRVQHASTSADLSSHRERLAELQQDIVALESKIASNVTVSSRPVPVRVFDGTRLVALGWIPASATNRAGLAGDGIATVFLDRRSSAVASSGGPSTAESLPASPGAATASTFALTYQSYPWFWPGVWWGREPDPDPEPTPDPRPQPTVPPLPGVQPPPTPTQYSVARTAPQRQPTFSLPAARTAPFPPRHPTVAPIQPRIATPTSAGARGFSPTIARGVNPAVSRLTVQRR